MAIKSIARPAPVYKPAPPRIITRAPLPPKSAPQRVAAKPTPVRAQIVTARKAPMVGGIKKNAPTVKIGGRITSKSTSQPMGKMKGVIAGAKKVGALAGMIPGGIGKIAGLGATLLPDGTVVHHKKRHKGLTYNEIRGANRVLKLVKKFAPAGHKTALKVSRRRA